MQKLVEEFLKIGFPFWQGVGGLLFCRGGSSWPNLEPSNLAKSAKALLDFGWVDQRKAEDSRIRQEKVMFWLLPVAKKILVGETTPLLVHKWLYTSMPILLNDREQ